MRKILMVLLSLVMVCGCADASDNDGGKITDDSGIDNPSDEGKTNPSDEGKTNPSDEGKTNPLDEGQTIDVSGCKPEPNPKYPLLVTDEDWARAMIEGKVSPDIAFPTIVYSCGFPVKTNNNSILFVHWYTGDNWSVAGDFNQWQPQQMTSSSDGKIWYAEVPVPAEISSQNTYKYVKNGTQYVSDPWSIRYNYDENGEISYIIKPEKTQHLMRWHMFESPQGLKTRSLYVLVPSCDGPYDVVYAHDGQNIFQTDGYSGGWKLRENMQSIQGNFLIVGISNTEERMYEYTHVDDTAFGELYTSKGRQYAAFVEESVRPFIESVFPVTQKAGVMGSSLGGLISLYIAHLYPNRYRAVLALSPTTAWGRFGSDMGTTIKDLYVQAGHRSTYLYLDNGGYEPEGGCPEHLGMSDANIDEADGASSHDNYCYTREFVDEMEKIGYQYDIDLSHWHEPGALHNEDAWAARVFRPLQLFMDLK